MVETVEIGARYRVTGLVATLCCLGVLQPGDEFVVEKSGKERRYGGAEVLLLRNNPGYHHRVLAEKFLGLAERVDAP